MSATVHLVHVHFPLATYVKEIFSRSTNTNASEMITPCKIKIMEPKNYNKRENVALCTVTVEALLGNDYEMKLMLQLFYDHCPHKLLVDFFLSYCCCTIYYFDLT